MSDGETAPLLSLSHITHRFGSVRALDDAMLRVRPGTVHAVLGENGAGKTTLLRVAFGMLHADSGSIEWEGKRVTIPSPAAALARGIGMVHQHFTLVPAMTVAENVALGGHGAFNPRTAAERVNEVSARAGLALDPGALVSSLSVGAQQRCEIVKALARDVKLLVLDEPTAVLAPSEAAELLGWMRRYADAGHGVVLITHKLRDALAIADDVTVLRRGRTVLTARASESSEESLAAAMLGEQTEAVAKAVVVPVANGPEYPVVDTVTMTSSPDRTAYPVVDTVTTTTALERVVYPVPDTVLPSTPTIAAVTIDTGHPMPGVTSASNAALVIEAKGIHVRDARGTERVRGADLAVRRGEIVGIAAVEGAGQYQLLRVLAGRLAPHRGTLTLPTSIGFVPEDRHHDALMLDAPLFENVALRGASARSGRIDWTAFRAATKRIIAANDVRAAGDSVPARTLSGGNQQKLVLGREMADAPDAVVLENPSRGLDFRATAAVHASLRAARDAGAAVVLYSSDLDEVLALSDRVFAMHQGVLTEMPRDRELVGRAILGTAW